MMMMVVVMTTTTSTIMVMIFDLFYFSDLCIQEVKECGMDLLLGEIFLKLLSSLNLSLFNVIAIVIVKIYF